MRRIEGLTYIYGLIDPITAWCGTWESRTVHNIGTNGLENFWSLLKRSLKGTWTHVAAFHLERYCREQAWRFNNRKTDDGTPSGFLWTKRRVALGDIDEEDCKAICKVMNSLLSLLTALESAQANERRKFVRLHTREDSCQMNFCRSVSFQIRWLSQMEQQSTSQPVGRAHKNAQPRELGRPKSCDRGESLHESYNTIV